MSNSLILVTMKKAWHSYAKLHYKKSTAHKFCSFPLLGDDDTTVKLFDVICENAFIEEGYAWNIYIQNT